MILMLSALLLIGSQLVGSEFTYSVQPGDSLTSIGARFGSDARAVAEANALKPTARLQPGQTLKIDNRHIVPPSGDVSIVVNVPQRMLFYFLQGALSQQYPIAAGKRSWRTPLGKFEVLTTEEDPVWDVPVSIQAEMARQGKPVLTHVPPSPSNPLGKYWLGLSIPAVGIHGTNAPSSIYSLQTHGCIRLHPDDIERLFASVDEGTKGEIIYEPVLTARVGDSFFIEVHPDVYGRGRDPMRLIREWADSLAILDEIDWQTVTEVIRKRDGIARDVTARFKGLKISGYSSPATNAMLHSNSSRVAENSLHPQGIAADIRIPDRSLPLLRKAALAMKAGGVGYFPASQCVPVDVGRVRTW